MALPERLAWPEIDPSWFRDAQGIHGVPHAARVLTHAISIAEEVDLAPLEREAVLQATAWHDIGRTHDGWDWTHGMKSVNKMLDLELHEGHERELLDLSFFAMEYHAMWDHVGEKRAALRSASNSALRVLKDADGPDRVRIGDNRSRAVLPSTSPWCWIGVARCMGRRSCMRGRRWDGSTDISAGLTAGLQQLGAEGEALRRVFLLSDGLANQGITDAEGLGDLAQQGLAAGRLVSIFGVGCQFNENLLRKIADSGGGNYYYIGSPEDIPVALEQELGELSSVVGQNLTVDFHAQDAQVAAVLGFDDNQPRPDHPL